MKIGVLVKSLNDFQDMDGWVNFTERPVTVVKCSILFWDNQKVVFIYSQKPLVLCRCLFIQSTLTCFHTVVMSRGYCREVVIQG